jgi:hypothetical protein
MPGEKTRCPGKKRRRRGKDGGGGEKSKVPGTATDRRCTAQIAAGDQSKERKAAPIAMGQESKPPWAPEKSPGNGAKSSGTEPEAPWPGPIAAWTAMIGADGPASAMTAGSTAAGDREAGPVRRIRTICAAVEWRLTSSLCPGQSQHTAGDLSCCPEEDAMSAGTGKWAWGGGGFFRGPESRSPRRKRNARGKIGTLGEKSGRPGKRRSARGKNGAGGELEGSRAPSGAGPLPEVEELG